MKEILLQSQEVTYPINLSRIGGSMTVFKYVDLKQKLTDDVPETGCGC